MPGRDGPVSITTRGGHNPFLLSKIPAAWQGKNPWYDHLKQKTSVRQRPEQAKIGLGLTVAALYNGVSSK
jgi:hypothetical protein